MRLTRVRSSAGIAAACLAILVTMSACGGDSTGPSNLGSSAALQSLRLGLASVPDIESPQGAELNASFDAIEPILDQINVIIGGRLQTMFALGFRQSFPAGTCEESVFLNPLYPPLPGDCTPIAPEIGLILWQSHSASAAPDRLIVIAANPGISNFSLLTLIIGGTTDVIPAFALYLEGQDNVWLASSGTLTSQVAATNQSCGLPQPPYSKVGSCSIATFDEQGSITFDLFTDGDVSPTHTNLTIPRQTIHGLWEVVTEVQPVTLNVSRPASFLFGR